jgi:putative membrane protein
MWHNGFMMDPGFFFIAGFFKFLWFLFLIGLLFWGLRMFRRMRHAGAGGWGGGSRGGWGGGRGGWGAMFGGRDEALETARVRLARSELTPEQFEDLKRALTSAQQARSEAWQDMRNEWRGKARGWMGRDDALETARMRFAKGEISAEEFKMIENALER